MVLSSFKCVHLVEYIFPAFEKPRIYINLKVKQIIKEKKKPYIFACGPEPMLVAIRDYSLKNNIPTQLSVESYMGCGVGLCQGCVISKNRTDKKENSYHEQYSLVCIDGPVYEAKDIRFD